MLKKSAIEGFVKTEVLKTGLMKSPSVTAHLYKKKVKVDVKGLLTSRTNVPEQLEHIQSDVELGLKEFFGLEKKMNTRVFVKQVEEENVGNAIEHVDGLLAVNGGFFSNLKNSVVNSDSVTDGVNVEVGKKQVAVDLDIVAEYQKHVPTIFADIKKVVEAEVKRMTDLEVVEVNVNVVDIKTRAQHEEDSVTLQDRVTSAAQATGEFASNQVSNVKSAVGNGVDKVEDMKSEPRVQ